MIFIDLETRSSEDLRRAGGRRYSEHPSTRLLCAAWIFKEERHVWIPGREFIPSGFFSVHLPNVFVHRGDSVPDALPTYLPWVAHNAWEFDQLVWEKLYPCHKPLEWIDSANLARQQGWPGRLDAIGKLIRGEGKTTKHNKRFFDAAYKEPGVGDLILIAKYCLDDTEIMHQLWERLHSDQEPQVQAVHRAINNRGVRVDTTLLSRLRDLCVVANEKAVKECETLSGGEFKSLEDLRKRDKVFTWLKDHGCEVEKLDKKYLESWISENEDDAEYPEFPTTVVPFLRSRMGALRITSAKLDAALSSIANGRLDGLFAYCGAGVTGRFSARRMQVHNLPRPGDGIDVWGLYDRIGFIEPTPDEISALIRLVFLPEPGEYLAACDFNAVESRVLAWLADEEKLLTDFRADRSPYDAMCKKIFGAPPSDKKDPRRQIAKVTVLGCGYQLGPRGFAVYAASNQVDLEAAGTNPAACVYGFRSAYPNIVHFWSLLDYAAIRCVKTGDRQRVGKVEFRFDGGDLYLYLPSGRRLTFRRARIATGPFDNETVAFWSHLGFLDYLHGGKIAGLATQGTARDLLAAALIRTEEQGYRNVLHVHDEGVASVPSRDAAYGYAETFVVLPPWAATLPLKAECDILERYSKTARNKSDTFEVKP